MTTTDVKPPIPLDERLIADMPLDGGAGTVILLTRCHVTKAYEIEQLGCTGAAGFGLTIADIASLRIGLGGGGVGLPCFVPPDKFCLAHNTVGGLQREQEARHPANVAAISRELTPKEAGQVAFTETVRRTGKGGVGEQMAAAAGALGGFGELPRGTELVEEVSEAPPISLPPGVPTLASYTPSFTCPEHTKTNWSCRFCVAQAIVEGELDTLFCVQLPGQESHFGISGPELVAEVERFDAAGADEIGVYVLAATYKRKLTR